MGKRPSLMDRFVDGIEYGILKGDMKVGEKLPTLRTMAEESGYSRSVINAGIVELENRGYLKILPTKWITVADWRKEGTLAVIEGIMRYDLYGYEELKAILDCRKLIECECAYQAAMYADIGVLEELEQLINNAKTLVTVNERAEYDVNFHHLISIASGNLLYPIIMKSSGKSVYKLVSEFYKLDNIYGFVLDLHIIILNALKAHDADLAKQKMLELLKHGEQKILKNYLK